MVVTSNATMVDERWHQMSLIIFNLLQVQDFNIAKREEDISYYAGLVGEQIVMSFYQYILFDLVLSFNPFLKARHI